MASKYILAMISLCMQLQASCTLRTNDGHLASTALPALETGSDLPTAGERMTFSPEADTTVAPSKTASGKIVSDEVVYYFNTLVNTWLCLVLCVLGVVTNIITCIVFYRQGYKDSTNISMTSLALWDLVKSITGIFRRLGGVIGLISPAQGASWTGMASPTFGFLPVFCGYVSCALAAYVSVERCLCVSMPFKVKLFVTPKLTLIMVTLISVVVFGAYVVVFFFYDIIYVFSPKYNTTIAQKTYNSFFYANEDVVLPYYKTMTILIPFLSFGVLCISSVITVYYLKKSSVAIRGKSSKGGDETCYLTQREKQVTKMLVTVVLVYIIDLFPRIVQFLASLIEPEFYLTKTYNNLYVSIGRVIFVLDYINSSTNLFIFLTMSTNFTATFYTLFPGCRKNYSERIKSTSQNNMSVTDVS